MRLAGAAILVLAALACQTVPYTHRSHLVLVSKEEELSLGESSYRQALSQAKLSDDPAANAMLQRVGRRLARAADRPDYKWEFHLIDDPKTVNAWCLPGGKVAVYTGILPVAQNDDGLAVVLGHEIAHALADRPAETQQLAQQAYGLGANVGVLLPFSREQESEADHIGLILMAKAGYDPADALAFWQRMSKATGGGGGDQGLGRYLRTHPPDAERIKKIQQELPEARRYYRPAP